MEEEASRRKQRLRFLDAACGQQGFCLPPKVKEGLIERSGLSPKEFVRAVIEAEGLEPIHLESYEHFGSLMGLYQKHVSEI